MDTLEIIRRAAPRPPNDANARSVVVALDRYGARFGLARPFSFWCRSRQRHAAPDLADLRHRVPAK